MALPTDVQAAVAQIIANAQAQVADAVDALTSGGNTMLAAASALQGQPVEHPALDEVLTDITQADQQLASQLGTAVAAFRANQKVLSDAMPAAPAS